ncbi:sugar phosphate isomerase/epimerase family protein [Thermosediminibacter oceani]|uniref:Xylose isomerase domain protein TIM barrel n=1 Tax=Thermosediminibacter oceani (strain ATCC BAA-1034 / DSM 16646 / JW/IW-1228P) TaxID=555079 RepID=D9S2M8_THEOJ|nr:sugar phosphate isomerase/epimerase family protein [Thermosediminibacter oceani]ADL07655.1 Xylose isomerase domain protein TIM barrel [Thermosediminibacter oceani DSM 16646]
MKQYGIFAWFGYLLPMETRLRLISEAGFDCVMLWWGDEFYDTDGEKTGHVDLARRYGLNVVNAHAPYEHADYLWDDGVNGDAYEALLSECIKTCAACEIPTLVIHPTGGPSPSFPVGNTGIQRLLRLLEEASRLGVTLALENLQRPDYLEYIFCNISSDYLGFCYDSGHAFLVSGGLSLLDRYGHLLRALHLHDNDGSEDQHLVPGEGNIDWEDLRLHLDAVGYSGPITLECCAPWHPDIKDASCESPESYLARALKAAKKLFR